jgi:hypothetical protein
MGNVRIICVAVAAMMSAASTWADIYRWTDKDGNVNFSDVAPTKEQHARDVVVVTRSKPASQQAGPSQQELLARVQNLEQQLQAQQYAAATQAPPPVAYYPAPTPLPQPVYQPPVQPMAYYDNSAYDDGSAYTPYAYPVAPVYVITTLRGRGMRHSFRPRTPLAGSFRGMPGTIGGPRPGRPPMGHRLAAARR